MSLARAMTKRMRRSDANDVPAVPAVPAMPTSTPLPLGRNKTLKTVKAPKVHVDRSKISAPVALVSTTNMLSYNAPDVASYRKTSTSTSSTTLISSTTDAADDSDNSISTRSRASSHASRDTLTDASSVSSSPTSPAPNHLSGYFASANKNLRKSASSGNLQHLRESVKEEPVPAIPERALSHSKRAHERLAQKRSLQNMSRHSSTRSSREHRTSADMFTATIQEESHPFGKELEQLSEVVEEFGGVVRDAAIEADLTIMRERNLATFCAADYLAEIQPLFDLRFSKYAPAPLAWI